MLARPTARGTRASGRAHWGMQRLSASIQAKTWELTATPARWSQMTLGSQDDWKCCAITDRRKNISTCTAGIHYPIPIHLQPAYRDLGHRRGDFPVTESCAQQVLSLPMYAELTQDQIEYVAKAIRDFMSAGQDAHSVSKSLDQGPSASA